MLKNYLPGADSLPPGLEGSIEHSKSFGYIAKDLIAVPMITLVSQKWPLDFHLKVCYPLGGANNSSGLSRAGEQIVFRRARLWQTIGLTKFAFTHRAAAHFCVFDNAPGFTIDCIYRRSEGQEHKAG